MNEPKLPPLKGPDRVMPIVEDYPDRRSYDSALSEWWKDVEDNPKDMPNIDAAIDRARMRREAAR